MNYKIAIEWAKFWSNCCVDAKVRARLQDQNLPIKLYGLIKETDPKGLETRIIKEY